MPSPGSQPSASRPLPALRLLPDGSRRVDYAAIVRLAWPLFVNAGMQAALNLTDTWFLGRLSTDALAAVGAVFFLVLVFVVFLGGVGNAVQTLSAQAFGAGSRPRAAGFAFNGLWGALLTAPAFAAVAFAGPWLLAPFQLPPGVNELALEYWFPRLLGGFLGTAQWALAGFFNGIGRTRVTLATALGVTLANAGLNQWFIFGLGWGVAGAAWATAAAQGLGAAVLTLALLAPGMQSGFRTRLLVRPRWRRLRTLFVLGIPMGMAATADLSGFAMFQLMLARLGALEAAASQVVMMLTSVAYMPAIGIALAGTTLVGQSIGAGDRDWAQRTGSATIRLAVIYMGGVSVALALGAPLLLPLFADAADPNAAALVELGTALMWIAAGYQVFDALNLGAAFCLRGAGDVRFAAVALLVLAWGVFVPTVHMLAFAPGQGLVDFLPQWGMGAKGAWLAALGYIILLGVAMFSRWLSGAWKRRLAL
ncbi:MAG: MATE family efflux transporter [Planctomycetes bacterium]|nr:MATE family efflux transporter [Planctomycetota bacterium]